MTDWDGNVISSSMDPGNDGGGSSSSGVNNDVVKRKYGNPHSPQKERTLLVTKNKKIRQSQACDRCRLKKIKCDGLKPSCSQCLKVNFQCRTSDRLTRRGFPRGYTEMLESEVVRLQKILEDKSHGKEGVVDSQLGVELQAASPKYEGDKADSQSFSEPQFPFINDTFHYYNNYREDENYLGHCTWNILTNTFSESKHPQLDTKWLNNSHISMTTDFLQLEPKSFFFPKFLLVKYENNLVRLKRLVKGAIADFNRFQNSLVPLLHPFDKWQSKFMSLLKGNNTPDPVVLLTLLYIIQLNWSCLDESRLFQLTKMICSSSKTSLKNLQCLLLGSSYFMGSQVSNKIDDFKIWASELLHMAYAMVLDLGLYINSNRQIPMVKDQKNSLVNNSIDGFSKEGSSHDVKIISFWSFQFLDSWWSLIQGLPKSNFLVDEFHPQSVASLKIPTLKPFTLLLNFTTESLDGCNLLHTLSSGNNNGKSKLVYLAESFRQLLVKWKLYHQLQDHEDDLDPEDTEISLSLTKPDVVEIQLTLFYLIISYFSDEKINKQTSNENENAMANSNLEDTAYEIISLYYLLLMDQSHLEQPRQFNILHVLPCPNKGIINSCLSTLNDWAMSPQDANELEGQLNWKYNKYQHLLTQWCQLYYIDEPNDPVLVKLALSYKIHLKRGNRHSYIYPNKLEYLEKVEQYNNNIQAIGRSNLVRSNSHAIMDQFNMFAELNSMKPIFNNTQILPGNQEHVQTQEVAQDKAQNENGRSEKEEQLTQNDNNNIIDMSHYRSQILAEHDETDDGYAEDDDEDDEDDLRPLEIPFSTKRTGSLFQNKQNQPPLHHQQKQAQLSNRRRTLDHIILENKDYNLEEQQPAVKKARQGSSSNKPKKDLSHDTPRSESIQNPSSSSDASNAFHNYSINPSRVAGPPTNGSHSTATNSGGGILPPPPPPRHDTLFDHSMSMNSSTKTGSNHSTHTPQIIETPRAFVDMLLLQSSDQQRTVNPSPGCTSSNIDKHSSKVATPSNVANDIYKGT